MNDERYRAFSQQISRVKTRADGDRLADTLNREPRDEDRETLRRSLAQHMASIGVLEPREA